MYDRLSLSVAWNYRREPDPDRLVDEAKALGFGRIEIYNTVTERQYRGLLRAHADGRVVVSSIHGFAPNPDAYASGGGPEVAISSPDEADRRHAVDMYCRNIREAAEHGIDAIVVHAGQVCSWREMGERFGRIRDHLVAGGRLTDPEAAAGVAEALRFRAEQAGPRFEQVLRSVEQMNEAAVAAGVRLGFETRVGMHEIPYDREFDVLFDRFAGGACRFWHDIGHGQVLQQMWGLDLDGLLERLGPHLIGMHVHDVQHPLPDHRAPGDGVVDFAKLERWVGPDTLLVLEIGGDVPAERIRIGVSVLGDVWPHAFSDANRGRAAGA